MSPCEDAKVPLLLIIFLIHYIHRFILQYDSTTSKQLIRYTIRRRFYEAEDVNWTLGEMKRPARTETIVTRSRLNND